MHDRKRIEEVLDKSEVDMLNSPEWWRGYDYATEEFIYWITKYIEGGEVCGAMSDERLDKIRKWIAEHR